MPVVDNLKVQIGWEDNPGNLFALSRSTLNGLDVLDGLGASNWSGTYDDVSTDVSDGPKIVIGRDDALVAFNSSTCTFTLAKPGYPDYYNPNAVAGQSVIAGLSPGFKPMRPVRVQAVISGTTTTIWAGFIRSADWNSDDKSTTVHAEDLFLWLSRVKPTYSAAEAASAGVVDVATAIGFILTKAGWTNSAYRDLGDGTKTGDAVTLADNTTAGSSALELIANLLITDRGLFWVQGGVATYRARTYKFERTSLATLQSESLRTGSNLDLDRIINRQSVTKTGNSPQVANNYPSQQSYGIADGTSIDSANLSSDTAAANLSTYILQEAGSPRPPITLTLDNDTTTNLSRQVAWKVLDRLTAPVAFALFTFGASTFGGSAGFGGTQDYHIERIEQDWAMAGNYVTTKYTLSRRGYEVFRFDYAAFDQSDTSLTTSAVFSY